MMRDPNLKKVNAVTDAFMPMRKLDLATLEKAFNRKRRANVDRQVMRPSTRSR